jgi:hypothetical protein
MADSRDYATAECVDEKDNYCPDYGSKGKANALTDHSVYDGYIHRGWKGSPGTFNVTEGRVEYPATPVYWHPKWTTCGQYHNPEKWLGIKTKHHYARKDSINTYVAPYRSGSGVKAFTLPNKANMDGNDGTKRMKCPSSGNSGPTPAPQLRCLSCGWVFPRCDVSTNSCFGDKDYQYLSGNISSYHSCTVIGGTKSVDAVRDKAYSKGKDQYGSKRIVKGDFADFRVDFGHVNCSYPSDTIKTESQLIDFQKKVRDKKVPDNPQFVDPFMLHYCSQVNDKEDSQSNAYPCIMNHHSGEMSRCTNFTADNHGGRACRAWLEDVYKGKTGSDADDHPYHYDHIIKSVCNEDPTLPECLCMRREDDVDYKNIKNRTNPPIPNGSAGCWYAPCKEGVEGGMLIDSNIRNTTENNLCPANLCMNIVDLVDINNSEFHFAEQNVMCEFEGKTATGAPDSDTNAPDPVEDTPDETLDEGDEGDGEGGGDPPVDENITFVDIFGDNVVGRGFQSASNTVTSIPTTVNEATSDLTRLQKVGITVAVLISVPILLFFAYILYSRKKKKGKGK